MNYTVTIRDNTTGETRVCPMECEWHEHSVFWWTEGNFSCDCNRRIVFDGDVDAAECGHTRFSALYAELEDGSKIELDG